VGIAMRDLLVILTPIAVVLLLVTRLVSLEKLKRNRGYALILAFVISAAVRPPSDAISMSIMAVSLYVLYEFGMFFGRFPLEK
jgi:sec-independent protein translocase protein TatC